MNKDIKIRKLKPTTPSNRHRVLGEKLENSLLPIKKLVKGKISSGGRNSSGRITTRHHGGGHKKKYRNIDLMRNVSCFSESYLLNIEYDPTRTAFINRYYNKQFKTFYTLGHSNTNNSIQGKAQIGQYKDSINFKIDSPHILNLDNKFKEGNTMRLKDIPTGLTIYNIQSRINKNTTNFSRSAGCSSTLIKHEGDKCLVRLPSKATVYVDSNCIATIGSVNNSQHSLRVLGKAGASR
jgi:large subunit ribosomal protein L2